MLLVLLAVLGSVLPAVLLLALWLWLLVCAILLLCTKVQSVLQLGRSVRTSALKLPMSRQWCVAALAFVSSFLLALLFRAPSIRALCQAVILRSVQ